MMIIRQRMLILLILFYIFASGNVWAAPFLQEHSSVGIIGQGVKKVEIDSSVQKFRSGHLGGSLLLLARATGQKEGKDKLTSSAFSFNIWMLETLGAVAFGAGVLLLTVGYGNLSLRDQLACVDAPKSSFLGGCQKGAAVEIKDLQDSGITLLSTGWIVGSVGLITMIVGGTWLLLSKSQSPDAIRSVNRSEKAPFVAKNEHATFVFYQSY